MQALTQKLRERVRGLLPIEGFHFDRPLVLLQSDDWGRVGLRDQEGLEELQAGGIVLGQQPHDFHTLETAEDLSALRDLLRGHRDSTGRCASMGMNFIVANLDFARMEIDSFQRIHFLPLSEGLPRGWNRPNLRAAFRDGANEGIFHAALHGMTHFCRPALERELARGGERLDLLRTLWRAGTPYIHWRMPWIGYEYWDPEQSADERYLPLSSQRDLIGQSLGAFTKLFSALPRSACAPGYRAGEDTHRAWADFGVRIAQSGPKNFGVPHLDRYNMLHLYRTVEFEPAVDPAFSVEASLCEVEACFRRQIPAVISMHSINFHSSVRDFRSRTVKLLDDFLTALETKFPDLLYVRDDDVFTLVNQGSYETSEGTTRVNVTRRRFTQAQVASYR